MKRFAVAFLNQFDNVLELKIVEANDWKSALEAAKPGYLEHIKQFDTIEQAAEEAFNQEWNFNVVEIP